MEKLIKIKTFPVQMVDEELKAIREKAAEQGKTIKSFIAEAIKEKMEK
jgi:predicted DNA binding CopG/RHH family protein